MLLNILASGPFHGTDLGRTSSQHTQQSPRASTVVVTATAGGGVQRKSCGGRGSLRPSSVRGDVTVNCRSGAMVSHGQARPVPVQAGRSLCTWPSSSAFPSFWGADIFPCCLYFLVLFILLFTYWWFSSFLETFCVREVSQPLTNSQTVFLVCGPWRGGLTTAVP